MLDSRTIRSIKVNLWECSWLRTRALVKKKTYKPIVTCLIHIELHLYSKDIRRLKTKAQNTVVLNLCKTYGSLQFLWLYFINEFLLMLFMNFLLVKGFISSSRILRAPYFEIRLRANKIKTDRYIFLEKTWILAYAYSKLVEIFMNLKFGNVPN